MANMVGGTSVHYGTQSWRFRPDDFTVRTDTIDRYGEEALPEGSSTVDWPVTYDDLEPYYDLVEYEMGVSGEAGSQPIRRPTIAAIPDAASANHGVRSDDRRDDDFTGISPVCPASRNQQCRLWWSARLLILRFLQPDGLLE